MGSEVERVTCDFSNGNTFAHAPRRLHSLPGLQQSHLKQQDRSAERLAQAIGCWRVSREGRRAYIELVEEGVDREHHDEVHDHADDEEGEALQATSA